MLFSTYVHYFVTVLLSSWWKCESLDIIETFGYMCVFCKYCSLGNPEHSLTTTKNVIQKKKKLPDYFSTQNVIHCKEPLNNQQQDKCYKNVSDVHMKTVKNMFNNI